MTDLDFATFDVFADVSDKDGKNCANIFEC